MMGRIIPIAAVGMIGLGLMLPRIIERFETAPEASGNTRMELALCAKEMILDEPWRGVGMNNWGINYTNNNSYNNTNNNSYYNSYYNSYNNSYYNTNHSTKC